MELQLPDDFRCPISLEVMTDPVILSSGHTFDRSSIQRWLDAGNRTCPVTNVPLPPSPSLIPNYALRNVISSYLAHRPSVASSNDHLDSLLLSRFAFPSDVPTLSAVLHLAQFGGAASRCLVADSGAISVLIRHADAPDRPDLQELALRSLLHISLDGDDARLGLLAEGALDPVVSALRGGAAAALATTLLTSLAVVDVNKATIGAQPAAIPSLAALLSGGDSRQRREAATALHELCKFAENRRRAVRAGVVAPLISFASEGSERAVRVLGLLAKCREGKEEMRKRKGFVRALANVVKTGNPRGVEHALVVLNLVCSDSKEMALEAIGEGILDLCSVLASDINQKVGKDAMELARRLRIFSSPCISANKDSRNRSATTATTMVG